MVSFGQKRTEQKLQVFWKQLLFACCIFLLPDRCDGPSDQPANSIAEKFQLLELGMNDFRKVSFFLQVDALPKFNSSPLKSDLINRKVVFQPPFLRGYVNLRGGNG